MSKSYRANGDIYPCRFVTIASADDSVTAGAATTAVHGISQRFARDAPIPGASTLAAASGDDLLVHGEGEEDVLLELNGTVARGGRIESDTAGKGIPMATTAATQRHVGAIANESGVAGDIIRVRVHVEVVTYPA